MAPERCCPPARNLCPYFFLASSSYGFLLLSFLPPYYRLSTPAAPLTSIIAQFHLPSFFFLSRDWKSRPLLSFYPLYFSLSARDTPLCTFIPHFLLLSPCSGGYHYLLLLYHWAGITNPTLAFCPLYYSLSTPTPLLFTFIARFLLSSPSECHHRPVPTYYFFLLLGPGFTIPILTYFLPPLLFAFYTSPATIHFHPPLLGYLPPLSTFLALSLVTSFYLFLGRDFQSRPLPPFYPLYFFAF